MAKRAYKNGMHNGICSPMAGNVGKMRNPTVAANTLIKGSSPAAAPMNSPLPPKNPAPRHQDLNNEKTSKG